jgi:hypothetical protein
MRGLADPTQVQFFLQGPDVDDYWTLEFHAPWRANLTAGSYPGAHQWPPPDGDNSPGLDVSSHHTSCADTAGAFTVNAIAFDADGRLRTFNASFEQQCDGNPATLRGTIDFHAA